jgi:nucleoside-diphosphate-sugar epimerase
MKRYACTNNCWALYKFFVPRPTIEFSTMTATTSLQTPAAPIVGAGPPSTLRVCVTGGSGFIGTRLCEQLLGRGSVDLRILDKVISKAYPALTDVADVRSESALLAAIPEHSVVVHLAAEHRDDIRPVGLYDEVNVGGARNVCRAATARNVQSIVFTSTVAVYGFAPLDTDESGAIRPFNDYGRTKYEAEQVFRAWQQEAPEVRTLVIVRPTVVFGERNRGNVYNLLRQVASGRFVMIGTGENRKSMAYVENLSAFLGFALGFKPGVHVYNYIDKPDFTMNQLVAGVRQMLGKGNGVGLRLPYALGYALGKVADGVARLTGRSLPISAIRVKKFCANTAFSTSVGQTGFVAPVALSDALLQTVRYEFVNTNKDETVFYTE